MDAAEIPFGKFVRKVRRDRDMTQEELAAFLGVSRDRIANIETGKTMLEVLILLPKEPVLVLKEVILLLRETTPMQQGYTQ